MSECIAALNAGSSSIKFALYDAAPGERLLYHGQVEKIGVAPHFTAQDADGNKVAERSWENDGFDHVAATNVIIDMARALAGERPVVAVGHRVVHGGTSFAAPVQV